MSKIYINRGYQCAIDRDGIPRRISRAMIESRQIIPKGFDVHHINGNKQDDRFENLEIFGVSKDHISKITRGSSWRCVK